MLLATPQGKFMKALWIALFLPFLAAVGQAAAPAWPQERSEFRPDPAIRYGSLPNGLRYMIRRNSTPAEQVALRLRMDVGSVNEDETQLGLAHFLEHMAFKGSANVPAGEVEKALQRLGLRFGADTNASTSQTETIYQFDLAHNDAASLDTGLRLLREIGDRLTLDAASFANERGVVVAEARLRDSAVQQAQEAQQAFLLQGQLAAGRLPIGKLDILQNAPIERLREFYRRWYRPERATLVIVGDIDVDALETRIGAMFSDWQASGPAPDEPDLGKPAPRGVSAGVYGREGVPPSVVAAWVREYAGPPRTRVQAVADVQLQLGLAVLSRRLQAAAAGANRDFTQAFAGRDSLARSAEADLLVAMFEPGKWRGALVTLEKMRRQLLEQGVQPPELERELATLRTSLQQRASGAATRRSTEIVNGLLRDLEAGEVSTSPQQDLDFLASIAGELNVANVNAAVRSAFRGSGPLLFVSGPSGTAGDDKAVVAAMQEAGGARLEAAAKVGSETWPYTRFGRRGSVTAQAHNADLDLHTVRFGNGVRLNVKSTRFSADQILVNVHVGNGRLDLPRDQPNLAWALPAVTAGGLGKLSFTEMQRVLAGKAYRVGFGLTDSSYVFSGQTRGADLLLQLQVLAAYLTDAGWRTEAFEQLRASVAAQLPTLSVNPMAVMSTQLGPVLRDGDQRWQVVPSAEQLRQASPAALKRWLQPVFAKGAVEISIVGDVAVEQAVAAVAETFGALPGARAAFKTAVAGEVRFPAAREADAAKVLHHAGAPDQGIALVAWPTTDALSDLTASSQRLVLVSVVQDRLKAALRESEGASYTVQVQGNASTAFPGFGLMMAMADLPPAKAGLLQQAVDRIVAELAAAPPTADELERARNPALAAMAQARQTNNYWMGALGQVQREPRLVEIARQGEANLRAVTASDVQAAAARYLRADRMLKVLVQAGS